jgi:hypothetical protein
LTSSTTIENLSLYLIGFFQEIGDGVLVIHVPFQSHKINPKTPIPNKFDLQDNFNMMEKEEQPFYAKIVELVQNILFHNSTFPLKMHSSNFFSFKFSKLLIYNRKRILN